MVGECAGVGEVLLWWGTHLGSVREQAMIAWDYDVDLVVFVAAGTDIDMIWGAVCQPFAAHGYNMCKDCSFKFRVSPSDPLAWVRWNHTSKIQQRNHTTPIALMWSFTMCTQRRR